MPSEKTKETSGPLAGLKILEFAGLGPAPFCGMLLSDMGADVVRIDRHDGKDYQPEDVESRGRRSITLNLKEKQDSDIAMALIKKTDILIEGFRPGVMENLGLGPDTALTLNPQLVYGRMTGWGQSGPLAQTPGHDINYLALSGALHAMGPKEKPAISLNLIADFGGGALYLAMGILAALRHAEKTGAGQVIDCAMTDGVISMLGMIYGDLAVGKWKDERQSNVIDGGSHFYNVYQCADGKWISLAAIEPKFYAQLLKVTGATDGTTSGTTDGTTDAKVQDPGFSEQWNQQNWPDLSARLSEIFSTRNRDEWCELMTENDVCFAPVLSLEEAQQHPHNTQRSAFIEIDGISQPAPAPRFSKTPGTVQFGPVKKGANRDAIFTDWNID